MSARRAFFVAVAGLGVGLLGLARPSHAQCSYPFLGSGSPVYWSAGTVLYPTIVQSTNYWSAVAIRPDAGTDWDLGIYQTATTFPACVTNQLASSVRGGSAVDVVVGDFNHNAFGSYYVRPYVYSGTGNARIEWDDGAHQFPVGAPSIQGTTGPNDVLECWDILLEAGRNYSFESSVYGPANLKLLLFKNPASAPYWAGRNSAYYDIDLPPYSSSIGGLVVDQTDWYGLVVLNENGEASDYRLRIESCASPPTPLVSTVSAPASEPSRRFSFFQSEFYFAAVGVRPNQTSEYWALWLGEGAVDLAPQCYQTHRANSIEADKVAYIVGDFNAGANPADATYYTRAYPPWPTGSSTATVEWDDGYDQIVVGEPPILGNTDASDVLTCWDVLLEEGYRYRVHFTHGGAANLKLALFDNPGGVYWAPRSGAAVESGSTFYFDATRTDYYGLVLVNDNGGAGNWEIGIERCVTPIALAAGAPYLNIASTTNPRFALEVPDASWAALAVRCDAPSQDWNLTLYADQAGPMPHCFSNEQATSQLGNNNVDVIAGRPNPGAGNTSFFADPSPGLATSANGIFEWDQGLDLIPIGGPPLTYPTTYDDIVQVWDVVLDLGMTYTFVFERDQNVGAKLLLFKPTGLLSQGEWHGRAEAEFVTTGIETYTATASGAHGLVLVNEDGGIGNCRIGVYEQGGVAVDPALPPATRLEGIHPNPVARGSRILFGLATRSDVAFDVVNAAGRRVSQLEAGTREPGHWGVEWTGTGGDGSRLAAGVYFVRMRVDGRAVEDARVVLLP